MSLRNGLHHRLWFTLLMSVLLWCAPAHAREVRVHVLYSTQSDVFLQYVHDLRLHAPSNVSITASAVSDPPLWTVPTESDVVVVAGGAALQSYALSERRVPVLAVLVSRSAYEVVATTFAKHKIAASAIYQDPPARRQLNLAKLLMPNARSVGFLHQSTDAAGLLNVQNDAKSLSLSLQSAEINSSEQLSSALAQLLTHSDFLLTSADSTIYNSTTIKLLLTATYRADKVLIGTSPALVKAGSLATTYSSTLHIAQQTHHWLQKWPDSKGAVSAPFYPDYFDVSVNADVARSLNISLPGTEKLLEQLRAVEATR